jgi:hypothetical protein
MLSRVIGHNPMSAVLKNNLGAKFQPESITNCTDEQVRRSSIDAKNYKQQVRRSEIFLKNQKQILDCQKKLEELALELLKYGLRTDEEITDYIASGIEAGAKYKAAILYRQEKARLAVLKTEAQFNADMGLAQTKTGGEIKLIADRYGIEVEFLRNGFQVQSRELRSQLKASADARQHEAITRQQQEAYWRGETAATSGKVENGGLIESVSRSIASWFKI